MIKIGILGLGSIATKAYLPLYLELNDQVEFHYFTRNKEKLKTYENKYNLTHTYSNMDDFFNLDLDACMIHTPTETHAKYIEQALDNHWHVFVDKPISQNYEEVEKLIQKAYDMNLILFTGFNRRYAPMNQKLSEMDHKTMMVLQKNRELVKQDATFAIFDMMIHMMDTSLFLLEDDVVSHEMKAFKDSEGNLSHALAYLRTNSTTCITSINMNAGARTETVEIMAKDAYAYSENLNKISWKINNKDSTEQFGDWTPTLVKRGFDAMIKDFIKKIKEDDYSKQEHALKSHYYCKLLVDSLEEA